MGPTSGNEVQRWWPGTFLVCTLAKSSDSGAVKGVTLIWGKLTLEDFKKR